MGRNERTVCVFNDQVVSFPNLGDVGECAISLFIFAAGTNDRDIDIVKTRLGDALCSMGGSPSRRAPARSACRAVTCKFMVA